MESDSEEEFEVGGIYARCQVAGQWYWWVLWAEPFNTFGRDDHWQPITSFVDADGTATALWAAFEQMYPREWGNITLIHRLRASLDFPFAQYQAPLAPIVYDRHVVRLARTPVLPAAGPSRRW